MINIFLAKRKSDYILLNKDLLNKGAKVIYKSPFGTFDNYKIKH